jgi:hypothetical protein
MAAMMLQGRAPGIHIKTDIAGRTITWEVTNEGGLAITDIVIPSFRIHDHKVPSGWTFADDTMTFHAWATDPIRGIRSGNSGVFRVTGVSSGCKPGGTTVRMTRSDGSVVEVPDVTTYRREDSSTLLLPPAIISALVLFQIAMRRRSNARELNTAA